MFYKQIARGVCKVINDEQKRNICIDILTRILMNGVNQDIKTEIDRTFTKEEKEAIAAELKKRLTGYRL